MPRSIPFLRGTLPKNPGLLARFLPPLPDGLAASWLRKHLPPGSWVLDPFGASPRLAVEAAWAGYRVLVAANNPIGRALIEWTAHPPAEEALQAALAQLAASHKGDERLEPHIKSLYMTECAACGQPVMADYFVWERGATAPFAKSYTCPNCHDSGERPASPADTERAARFSASGLHRARALERVVALNDPDRPHVEEALAAYLPRAVYALFTMINRLDGLTLPPERRNHLQALLLYACDQASSLWAHPAQRERPRQLTASHRFRENNIWLALEAGVHLWATAQAGVPLAVWPSLPPAEGGICLFEGRLRDLAAAGLGQKIGSPGAVVAALPRPNQAFWTLSALWAGWLWGREAVGPFKSVLRRRRYDWGWHTAALASTLGSLDELLAGGTPFWGLVSEAEPGFMAAAMEAAAQTGFDLEGLSLSDEAHLAEITWTRGTGLAEEHTSAGLAQKSAAQGGLAYLMERGEPADYLLVQAAALAALAQEHRLLTAVHVRAGEGAPETLAEPGPAQHFASLQGVFKEAFTFRAGFRRFEGSDQTLDAGHWWLRDDAKADPPLADRVEMALVRTLIQRPGLSLNDLDGALCEAFPGLFTPDLELLMVCLDSYGEQQPAGSGLWRLRPQEAPAARRFELEEVRRLTARLGESLGYIPSEDPRAEASQTSRLDPHAPLTWRDKDGVVRFEFYLLASAVMGEIVIQGRGEAPASARRVIVLPGSRANLAAYKLQKDPHLKVEMEAGWQIVKYRHLRRLVESPFLTTEIFVDRLSQDLVTYSTPGARG